MPELVNWSATRRDGSTALRDHTEGRQVPSDAAVLTVDTDAGRIYALLNPERGESVKTFTRRSIHIPVQGGGQIEQSMAVLELSLGEKKVWLYVHDSGIILSTEDKTP